MGVASPPSYFFLPCRVVVSLSLSRCFRGMAFFVRPSEGWKSMDKSVIKQDQNELISIAVNHSEVKYM